MLYNNVLFDENENIKKCEKLTKTFTHTALRKEVYEGNVIITVYDRTTEPIKSRMPGNESEIIKCNTLTKTILMDTKQWSIAILVYKGNVEIKDGEIIKFDNYTSLTAPLVV